MRVGQLFTERKDEPKNQDLTCTKFENLHIGVSDLNTFFFFYLSVWILLLALLTLIEEKTG